MSLELAGDWFRLMGDVDLDEAKDELTFEFAEEWAEVVTADEGATEELVEV